MITMALNEILWLIFSPIVAYLIGSIPFSYIITKWRTGEDLRKTGNKNVGGLNAMIKTGFNWGFLAGYLDYMKGLICIVFVLIMPVIKIPFDYTSIAGVGKFWEITWHDLIFIFVAIGVILGHNYPIYINFQGGRGIAVTVSFLVVANPLLLIVFIFSMVLFTAITRYVRPSQFLAMFIGVPVAFFISIFPPWILIAGLNSSFVLGLFTLGICLAIFPKYFKSFIDMFKGKEYQVGKTGGVILPDENKEDIDSEKITN
ncbi:MAG: glycerol-3-phosphate acyltransferase [Asgard group archaeon]|nr:glycerol-3-phosphate acyltransferase [Asgard group archaeon]